MLFPDLSPLLNPRSIAVIGASERHGSAGRLVIENLKALGYQGKIYPVNPKSESILGIPCYKSLESIGQPIDMVAILIGAGSVMGVLQTMVQLDIPACWSLASGFSESGAEGKQLQTEVAAFCKKHNILLCGPNCVGVLNMVDQYAAFSVAVNPNLTKGTISAVMQSGAILMGLANSARFGFRYLISAGNQAVLDTADYIGYLATDPHTKVIITFVEGIPDAEKFLAAVRAARQSGKPVLILKVGKSEGAQRAVRAHTGSLAGSDAVLDVIFKNEGVVRLNSLDELVEAAELFAWNPLPKNDGVCLISLSGGQIGLAEDLSMGLGINYADFDPKTVNALKEILPSYSTVANPLDAWGNGNLEEMYPACVSAIMDDPGIGLIAMSRDTPVGVAQREIEQSMKIAEAAVRVKKETDKAVCLFSNFSRDFDPEVARYLRENQVPYLQGTAETLHAIQAFEKYAAFGRKTAEKPSESPITAEKKERWLERLSDPARPLSEIEARKLLADYGIEGPHEAVAQTEDEALEIAEKIGYPVVMKILSADIQHKTESGGVKLGVKDAAGVKQAFKQIITSVTNYMPDAKIDGIIVQEMIPAEAIELIIGIVDDKTFGPVIAYGTGGILVELIKDSALAIPPLTKEQARELIGQTKGFRLLKGYRNQPEADIDALADTLVNVAHIALDYRGRISAMDINPLMVLPKGKGVRAVDALVELKGNPSRSHDSEADAKKGN